jgi:hypothetical protein
MNTIKRLLRLTGLGLILLLPTLAYSQDTSKFRKALIKKANPDEPGITAEQAMDCVGKDVYVRDTIFNYKMTNKNYRVFYVGNRDTSKSLQIIIKNDKIKLDAKSWIKAYGSFSGKVMLVGGRPAIIIISDYQLGTRIQI